MGTSPSSLANLNYPGVNSWDVRSGGSNVMTPVWDYGKITQALIDDQDNQQRISQLLEIIPTIPYWANVSIPFTGVASEVVTSSFDGITDPIIFSGAMYDTGVGTAIINVNSLNQQLMKDPVLIAALAGQSTDANRFVYWPQPLFIPPSTQIGFQWTNDATNPATAGNFTMIGRAVKGGAEYVNELQELVNRLNNLPYWINVDIAWTSVANESPANAFKGIANPTVVLGATTDAQGGSILPYVQPISSQLSKSPVPILSWAGLAGSTQPLAYLPQPLVLPPNQVMNFTFPNDGTVAQAAAKLALYGRLLKYAYA